MTHARMNSNRTTRAAVSQAVRSTHDPVLPVAAKTAPAGSGQSRDAALVGALDQLRLAHETLDTLVDQQQEHVQKANARGLEPVQQKILEQLAIIRELDTNRRRIVAELSGSPDTKLEQVTSTMIAPHRDAALELGLTLRALIHDIRHKQTVIREAATHLMGHMQGLARTLQQGISHAGVYGRQGHVEAGATVVSGVDISS